MEHMPLISVIVPVYKVETYLDKCISSIVNQTYSNLEIILVDDGSPDNCPAICDYWAARDNRIKVIHKENAGAGHTRNVGIDLAQGEIISFIDSDDYIYPQMYEYLISLMDDTTDVVECELMETESDYASLDAEENAMILCYTAEEAMLYHIQDRIFRQTPPNKLYRRSIIGNIRFPIGKQIDDEFFTYRIIANCRNLVHSDRRMYAYRQQKCSVMHKPYSLNRLASIEAKTERLEFIKEKMPRLERIARLNLFGTCIYAGQMSLIHLPQEQLASAKGMINEALKANKPSFTECLRAEGSNKVWFLLAKMFFWGTCRVKNILGKGL